MRRICSVAVVSAAFLLLACLPASAGSDYSFSNVALVGVSNTSVSGTFSFDNNTHKFYDCSVSFSGNSIFAGITAKDLNSAKGVYLPGQGWLFSWTTKVNGDLIWYSVIFNPTTGKFWAGGTIANWQKQGGFNYYNNMNVPEGGAMLSYLLLSAGAVFAGIAISGRQRRLARAS